MDNEISVSETEDLMETNNDVNVHREAISKIRNGYLVANLAGQEKVSDKEMDAKTEEFNDLMASLGADDGLKAMLVSQMAAVHKLQQLAFTAAKSFTNIERQRLFIKNTTMLSNVFVQQANLLHKLQGNGQQKVIVEHVHVYNGGQAVVGNVETIGQGGGKVKI